MFGIYIHFPYCRKRCPYCDFAVHARQRIPHERYLAAVLQELERRARWFDGRRAISLYFGGGTPSLWRPDCIAEVIAAVRRRFALDDEGEITVEANPDLLPREHLDALCEAGVNRLSLGVQSFAPRQLAVLGRLHGPGEARQAVRDARAAGFTNLSLDLMFGLPGQRARELDRDLGALLSLEPDHVSIYNLTAEARTAFGALSRAGRLELPESGACAEMYERIGERTAQAGYHHYEISSYARPGKRAVHNTLYWQGGEYLGLGCSAHSLRIDARGGGGAERFSTVRSVDHYFAVQQELGSTARLQDDPALASYEQLDGGALEREAMWLGLRLLDGIERRRHAARFGFDPVVRHEAVVRRLAAEGLADVTPEALKLTPRGVLFADEVAARFY